MNQYKVYIMLDHKYIEYLERDNIELLNRFVTELERNKKHNNDINILKQMLLHQQEQIDFIKNQYNLNIDAVGLTLKNLLNMQHLPVDIGIEINELLMKLNRLS